jgi:hypothetical protein
MDVHDNLKAPQELVLPLSLSVTPDHYSSAWSACIHPRTVKYMVYFLELRYAVTPELIRMAPV